MKARNLIFFLISLAGGTVSSLASDVAAQFKVQEGGRSGEGVLHDVSFRWEASAEIVKTSPVATLRTRNFSGENIAFDFDSPVTVNSVILYNVNSTSECRLYFYDAVGRIIPLDQVQISSPDGVYDFPSSLKDDGSLLFAAAWSEQNSYEVRIEFLDSVTGVKRMKLEFQKEPGLLDLRIRGTR